MSAEPIQTGGTEVEPEYSLAAYAPGDVSETKLSFCVEIIRDGGAVAISLEKTPELGYVAIAPQHRRRGLSHKIVDALVNAMPGSLFATTDDEHMMRTLSGAGFVRRGHEWPGHRGQLSLWLKESEKRS